MSGTEEKRIAVLIDQCKPMHIDAITLVKKYNRIFLGYPLTKKDAEEDFDEASYNLRDLVFDPAVFFRQNENGELEESDEELKEDLAENVNVKKRFSRAKGIAKIILQTNKLLENHSTVVYAVVYRPPFTYIGIIDSWNFEDPKLITTNGDTLLKDCENWWKNPVYNPKKSRQRDVSTKKRVDQIAHMALGFRLKENSLKCVSPILPISKIMIRAQAKLTQNSKFCKQIDEIYNGKRIESDLNMLTPTGFEILCCELLRLKTKQSWFHSGGMGDMGVDGFGMDDEGNVIGILQCKMKLDEDDKKKLSEAIISRMNDLKPEGHFLDVYICTLSSHQSQIEDKGEIKCYVLDRKDILELIKNQKMDLAPMWRWLIKTKSEEQSPK